MFRASEIQSRASVLADPPERYRTERRRVDDAYRRTLGDTCVPRCPAEARTAAEELSRALRAATATVSRALQAAAATPAGSARRRGRRRKATRTVPPAVRFWSNELVRLAEIDVWLRRETLDEIGVHVPGAVRVGSRAANGPHIAGLVADPDDLVAATLHQPWIGVDLQGTVDAGVSAESSPAPQSIDPPAAGHVTKAA